HLLGARLRHPQRSRSLAWRTAQHVQASGAGKPVVPGRQPCAVAVFLEICSAADQGTDGKYPHPGIFDAPAIAAKADAALGSRPDHTPFRPEKNGASNVLYPGGGWGR